MLTYGVVRTILERATELTKENQALLVNRLTSHNADEKMLSSVDVDLIINELLKKE